MKISKTQYDIWGKDYNYYVEAGADAVAYTTSSIIDNVVTTIENVIMSPTEIREIVFAEEGQYQITVIYGINGGVDRDTYDIRCYPKTKADIIGVLKDIICNCPPLGTDPSTCGNTPLSPVEQDVNLMQMTYNSMALYVDFLMSPSFLRNHSCCFMEMLGENYYKFETLIKNLYSTLTLNGYTPNSYYLMRLYTAYYYVMLYVMEQDMASCMSYINGGGVPVPPDPPTESLPLGDCTIPLETVEALFDIDNIKDCFVALGLDFQEIYDIFETCYLDKDIGICTIASVTPLPPEYGAIDNLTYTNYNFYVELDTVVTPTLFSWDVEGTPVNLVLDDNGYGQIDDVSVTGSSHNTSATYTFAVKGAVRWTLEGDNTNLISLQCNWILPAYYGRKSTSAFPIEGEILGGTRIVDNFATEITVPINTSLTEYGWIAVPVAESVQYSNWLVLNASLNGSTIGTTAGHEQFIGINLAGTVTVNGEEYYVYMYDYPSEVTDLLKLFKYNINIE